MIEWDEQYSCYKTRLPGGLRIYANWEGSGYKVGIRIEGAAQFKNTINNFISAKRLGLRLALEQIEHMVTELNKTKKQIEEELSK